MIIEELTEAVKVLDGLRSTGIHTRLAILLLTVYKQEGLKQTDYCEILNWRIQIINRYALNMAREGFIDLVLLDSDPRGRARAIVLKPDIREKIANLLN